MARIVVADAGPLIAFAGIGQLELLKRLFGEVVFRNLLRMSAWPSREKMRQ